MKHHRKTFTETIEYDEFEPGDTVECLQAVGRLTAGRRYLVTEFSHPWRAAGESVVFLAGYPTGYDARQFRITTSISAPETPKED